MLDPAVYDRTLSHWLIFKRVLLDWLMKPEAILLLLAVAIALSWLMLRQYGKHHTLKGGDAAQLMQLLVAGAIPQQALAYEERSRTTEENARLSATILQPQGVKNILLVTDPPHILRSLLTFRHFGFTVIPHTSPLPPDLSLRRKALMVVYEYLGLISYGLQGRLFPCN